MRTAATGQFRIAVVLPCLNEAAAIREVREETTLSDLTFAWGEMHTETGPYSRGKTARYYLAVTRSESISLPTNPEIGRPEHNEYRWVDYTTALRLVSDRVRPVMEWAAAILEHDAAHAARQAPGR